MRDFFYGKYRAERHKVRRDANQDGKQQQVRKQADRAFRFGILLTTTGAS